jgi:hypothetical protein
MKFSRIKIILFFQFPLLIDWVSEWLLFTANSAIFQLYYGENKLIINEMKKMTFSVFHYLTLSVRCEELEAHINKLYLFLKSTYCEYILEKILSTSDVGPILALIWSNI